MFAPSNLNSLFGLMSDDTRKKHFATEDGRDTELGNKALKGVGTGSAIGGTVGAILALVGAKVNG